MKKRLFICLSSIFVIGIIFVLNNILLIHKFDNKIEVIRYSMGNGSSQNIKDMSIIIEFTNNKVSFSNSYNEDIKEYKISKSKYKKLITCIEKNSILFSKKDISNSKCIKSTNKFLTVSVKGKIYQVGGKCVDNKTFNKIVNKIFNTIDQDTYNNYVKKIYEAS